jgi:hypothetical protein
MQSRSTKSLEVEESERLNMVLSRYKLPNDNVLIWLGTGGMWGKTKGVDNVLILAGGDVLFLETTKMISLHDQAFREDLANLNPEAIITKYELPTNTELIQDLKYGLMTGRYPLINQNPQERMAEYKGMIFEYISRISLTTNREERIRQFEDIKREIESRILETERG